MAAVKRKGTVAFLASQSSGGRTEPNASPRNAAAAAARKLPPSGWKVPILISYAYWEDRAVEDFKAWEGQYRLMLDSGAFTAYTHGKQVNLDEYCAFVKSPPVPLDGGYMMLDVIGDPEATRKNLDKMHAKGLKPIPIFTRGEDPKWWREYHKASPLVALGGVAMGASDGYVKWFEENVREGLPVHWLGYGRRDMVLHYRPTSYDSTAWVGGCRWGYVSLFHLGKYVKCARADVLRGRWRKEITDMGFDYDELKQEDCWRRHNRESYIGRISAVSWLLWARKLEGVGTQAVAALHPDLDRGNMAYAVKAYGVRQSGGDCKPNSLVNAATAAAHVQRLTTAYAANTAMPWRRTFVGSREGVYRSTAAFASVDGSASEGSNATAKKIMQGARKLQERESIQAFAATKTGKHGNQTFLNLLGKV